MPHNLYLHSSLVLTRKIDYKNLDKVNEANIYNVIESSISLFVSFLISSAVIITFGAYIISNPNQSKNINLDSASIALQLSFGKSAKYIWAIGLLAAGQSSTMTGTYAGQFVMEGFLNFQIPVYQRVMLTRSIAIVPAIIVTFMNQDSLLGMDTFLNILQSVQLPFALVPLIKFVSNKKIMGIFAISRFQTILATILGLSLFSMNFVVMIKGLDDIKIW